MFEKNKSFEVSKRFFEAIEQKINKLNPTFNKHYNDFNNYKNNY